MRHLFTCGLAVVLLAPAVAQRITKIGEFTAAQGDVQFLPGAMVIVHNEIQDGKTKFYKYRAGKFVRARIDVPVAITTWKSFSWESTDQYNQLDLNFAVGPSIAAFLPSYSKVKGYSVLPQPTAGRTVVVLCYATVPDNVPEEDRTAEGGPRNLHLLLLTRKSGPTQANTAYTKVADVLVAEEVAFGTMLVEPEANRTLVAVYFLGGGSSDYESLGVFLVHSTADEKRGAGNTRQVK